MPERRGGLRIKEEGDLLVLRENGHPGEIRGNLVNVSYFGFAADMKEIMTPDTLVRFELKMRSLRTPLKGQGRISYVKETKICGFRWFRVGVKFIDLDRDVIAHFLDDIQNRIIKDKIRKLKSSKAPISD